MAAAVSHAEPQSAACIGRVNEPGTLCRGDKLPAPADLINAMRSTIEAENLTIVIEPGRSMVAASGALVCRHAQSFHSDPMWLRRLSCSLVVRSDCTTLARGPNSGAAAADAIVAAVSLGACLSEAAGRLL